MYSPGVYFVEVIQWYSNFIPSYVSNFTGKDPVLKLRHSLYKRDAISAIFLEPIGNKGTPEDSLNKVPAFI